MTTMVLLPATAWSELGPRLTELGQGAGGAALDLLLAIAVALVGWALASLTSRLTRVILRWLRFDEGVRGMVGGKVVWRHEPAGLVARAVYWLIMAASLLLAVEMLGFHIASAVAERLDEVVPRIITSAVLFAVGSLVAVLAGAVTRRFLDSAEVRSARLQGQVVTAVLTGFAALLALDQLGFAAQFVMAIGIAAVSAAGLGLALAFGLGCRDLARDFVVEYLRALDEEGPRRPDR
jgi:hypothetical protein